MVSGGYNCRTLLLKIILSILAKCLHTVKTFPNSSKWSFMLKKKKGQQKKNLSASHVSLLSACTLQIFGGKATRGKFPSWFWGFFFGLLFWQEF